MVIQPLLELSRTSWRSHSVAGIHRDEQLGPITFHISLMLHLHFILLPFSIPSEWPPYHMQLLPKGYAILWPYTPDNTSIPDSGCILASLCLLPQPRMPRSPISASWYTSYPSGLPLPPPYRLPRPPRSHNRSLTPPCVHSILYPSLCIKVSYTWFPNYIRTTSSWR